MNPEAALVPQSPTEIWVIIIAMAIGTFGIRFSFLGLVGGRELPSWLLRYLRYTAVAVIPALIAPLVAWPAATGGQTDPARLAAALIALSVGYLARNVLFTVFCALGTLYGIQALIG